MPYLTDIGEHTTTYSINKKVYIKISKIRAINIIFICIHAYIYDFYQFYIYIYSDTDNHGHFISSSHTTPLHAVHTDQYGQTEGM